MGRDEQYFQRDFKNILGYFSIFRGNIRNHPGREKNISGGLKGTLGSRE
jgi:hypothetical protein